MQLNSNVRTYPRLQKSSSWVDRQCESFKAMSAELLSHQQGKREEQNCTIFCWLNCFTFSVNYLKCSAGQLNLLELWKQWAWWRISKTMVGFCSVERSEVGAVHSCHHTAGAWGENPPTWSGWSRLWGKFKLNSFQTTYWSEQCTQAKGLLSLAKISSHILSHL